MQIITLTTDLGLKDSYIATIKGSIYSEISDVKVIDITNNIDPFNIHQAAYVLRSCYRDFPDGTIHIISVDDELTINGKSTVSFIIPPPFPNNPIVCAPFFLDAINPFLTFFELPLVEIPMTISPLETILSHCLLKIISKE